MPQPTPSAPGGTTIRLNLSLAPQESINESINDDDGSEPLSYHSSEEEDALDDSQG